MSTFPNGRYRLKNQQSGTSLDVPPDTGKAQGWQGFQGNVNQLWNLENVGGELFIIKNAATGKALGVEGGTGRDGARVTTSDSALTWEIKHKEGGWAIFAQGTNVVIDLDNGKNENGAWVSTWTFSGSNQQYWVIEQS